MGVFFLSLLTWFDDERQNPVLGPRTGGDWTKSDFYQKRFLCKISPYPAK